MTTKQRICFVLHAPIGGGAERISLRLAQNLDRTKFDVTFLFFNATGDYHHILPEDTAVEELGMPIPDAQSLTNPVWIYRLGKKLKSLKPDIIFSNLGYTNLMVLLSRMLVPVRARYIIREAIMLSGYLASDPKENFKRRMYSYCYKRADAIISQSQAMKTDLIDYLGLNGDSITVINNFIDKHLVDTQFGENLDTEKEGLATDKPVIISVGRLESVKNFDINIRIFAEVIKTNPAYLWILGKGSEETRLKNLVNELGIADNVRFLGFVKNPYQYYRYADLILSASELEGFPNVLLESLYCDTLPVFSPFNDGIHEFFKDGENIIMIDKDIVTDAAAKIINVLNDRELYDRVLKHAKDTLQHFDQGKILPAYENVFLKEPVS